MVMLMIMVAGGDDDRGDGSYRGDDGGNDDRGDGSYRGDDGGNDGGGGQWLWT